MSSEVTSVRSGGVSFGGLLAVLFIGLKLTDNIAWSWLWVLSPLWLPLAFIAAVLFAVWFFAFVAWCFQ